MTKEFKKKNAPQEGHQAIQRIARNSIFLFLSKTFIISIRLLMVPIVARYLGVALFGYFALITAIVMAIRPVADFGLERIILREISKDKANKEHHISTTIILKLAFSFLLFIIFYQFLDYFSLWNREINSALIVAMITEIVLSFGHTYLHVIRSFERMEFELCGS